MSGVHQDIRIGTLVFGNDNTADIIRQLVPHGFESFSIMFWLNHGSTDLAAMAERVNAVLTGSGAVVSSLSVFGNPLESNAEGEASRASLRACIELAQRFGCDLVTGFTGRVRGQTIPACIPRFKEVWTPLAELAASTGVRLAFENCNAGGNWQTGDFNIAHNPLAWELMFDAIPLPNLGLEWEPCHQLLALIDPMPQLQEWVGRMFHIHGKDASVDWPRIRRYGIFSADKDDPALKNGKLHARPFAQHRTPGFGDSNWTDIISELRLGGFKGAIDIEGWHDPVYRGEWEMTGQVHALNHLKQCRGGAFVANPVF